MTMRDQLALFGKEDLKGRSTDEVVRKRVDWAAEIASNDPDVVSYMHAGLCLAALPQRKPRNEFMTWSRANGNYNLRVRPGEMPKKGGGADPVGLPYGTRARLILLYLMGEAVRTRSPVIPLASGLSAWLRSIGLKPRGGPRGTITPIREQALRLARCSFTLRVDSADTDRAAIIDGRIVDGFETWAAGEAVPFPDVVSIDQKFYDHLLDHAVPLDERAIANLKSSALGLDLYVWLAYRLPRLSKPLTLRWSQLSCHFGSTDTSTSFGRNMKSALEDVLACYPDARVEPVRGGLKLYPSMSSVPKKTKRLQIVIT